MAGPGEYVFYIVRCLEERAFDDVAPTGNGDGRVYTIPQDGLGDYEVALSSFQVSAWHSDQALREHQKGSK